MLGKIPNLPTFLQKKIRRPQVRQLNYCYELSTLNMVTLLLNTAKHFASMLLVWTVIQQV